MGDERPTEGSIYDIKFLYNSKLVRYTTSQYFMSKTAITEDFKRYYFLCIL